MIQKKIYPGESPELKTLRALVWMTDQYLSRGEGMLDNVAMSPGELALEVLVEHGLVNWMDGGGTRFGTWTDEGQRLLDRYE